MRAAAQRSEARIEFRSYIVIRIVVGEELRGFLALLL